MFNLHFYKRMPFASITALAAFFVLSLTAVAFAGVTGDDSVSDGSAASLGELMCNAYFNAKPFGSIFIIVAYCTGALFATQGIRYFQLHTESPQNHKLTTPVMLWVGAMLLLALPSVIPTVITSLYGVGGAGGFSVLDCGRAGAVSSSGASLDQMLTGFVGNISAPILSLVQITAILCGLFMIVHGLSKAGKYGIDPKTHSIHSILANIGFGGLIMAIGENMNIIVTSVFGGNATGSYQLPTINGAAVTAWAFVAKLGTGAGSTQFANAIGAALTFVQLIGAIGFLRGWLIMKKVVEGGGGNVTLPQGLTFIIGGVLAINIGAFLKIMDATFGTNLM